MSAIKKLDLILNPLAALGLVSLAVRTVHHTLDRVETWLVAVLFGLMAVCMVLEWVLRIYEFKFERANTR